MPKEIKTETRTLACKLTEDELRKAGRDLAATVQDMTQEEGRQESIKSGLKAKITELSSRRDRLAGLIARGEDYREVEVIVQITDDGLQVQEIRKDTNEVFSTRIPYDKERQLVMKPAIAKEQES